MRFAALRPINIRLRPHPLGEVQAKPRWARVREADHAVRYYGTLRAFPATHYSSGVLTDRSKHELPQCLYCYDAFAANWATSRCRELPQRMAVSPRFAEWLMGSPENCTHPELPLVNRCEHFVFRSKFLLWVPGQAPSDQFVFRLR